MTVKELRNRLAQQPDELAVAVQLQGEISCRDLVGDPITATAEGFFQVTDTRKATEFCAGKGFCPIVLLQGLEYT